MGCVKPSYIKNFAMELLKTHEEAFSTDFEQNKMLVKEYTDIEYKTITNRVAGYITRIKSKKSKGV